MAARRQAQGRSGCREVRAGGGQLRHRGGRAEVRGGGRHALRSLAVAARGAVGASSSMPTSLSRRWRRGAASACCRPCGALVAAMPQAVIPAQIEFSAEQIMLGGRPLQNIAVDLHADATILDGRPAGISRARVLPAWLSAAATCEPGRQFHRRAQRRIVRSRYAGGVAAGPYRSHLSQPEAVAPARRRQRGRGSRRDRRP